MEREGDRDAAALSVVGKGYRGQREGGVAHFAATSDQRGADVVGEAMLTAIAMIATEHGSYNKGKEIYIPEDGVTSGE